jgi:thiamine-phosphate pyrophosphorylase
MSCYRWKPSATGPPPLPSAAEPTDERPIVCYVTDGNSLDAASRPGNRTADVLAKIQNAMAAGVDWVQIRERDLPAKDLLSLARGAVETAVRSGRASVEVILNDRVDVALAARAAGVHLGSESLPVADVRGWCRAGNAPRDWLVGASCHSLGQAQEAESAGASYIFFGPIFDTPSKRPFGPPQGLRKLEEVSRAVGIDVVAIGGINQANALSCLAAGAAGVAAIRLFQQSSGPAELMPTLEALHAAGSKR